MPRRPSLVPALALVLATAALTACADPTAPTPSSSSSADLRHSGYAIATKVDSTSTRIVAVRHSGYVIITGKGDPTNP